MADALRAQGYTVAIAIGAIGAVGSVEVVLNDQQTTGKQTAARGVELKQSLWACRAQTLS
jgi:hypothetical protein